MRTRLEQALSGALTIAALAIAAVIVKREFVPSRRVPERNLGQQLTFERDWESMLPNGLTLGSVEAPLKAIEFVDFECPVCRTFHDRTLREIQKKYGPRFSLTLLHSPLSMHRFAGVTARAVECAVLRGGTARFVDLVFAKQDSLGLKSWGGYAGEAGMVDTLEFTKCVTGSATMARIDSGLAIFHRNGISGTPTLIVNGWRFSIPPSEAEFVRVAEALLAGRQPAL